MNVGGMCEPGYPVGYRNCTWEPHFQIVKTVTLQCAHAHALCNGNYTQAGLNFTQDFQNCPAINAVDNAALNREHAVLRRKAAKFAKTAQFGFDEDEF